MKRISSKKWQANLTMLIMGGLLGLSIACGSHSYIVQRQKLIAEMDNALQTIRAFKCKYSKNGMPASRTNCLKAIC